jgi:hypothetical protein
MDSRKCNGREQSAFPIAAIPSKASDERDKGMASLNMP